MNKDVVKNALICLTNMKIENTTYEIARDIVLDEYKEKDKEIERLQNIIKELREILENNDHEYTGAINDALEILDKENIC